MEKEFFYLDGKEQKGPFTKEQLTIVELKPDTLVWTDGFENWKPLKEVDEFKVLLKKMPPPPPLTIIDNSPPCTIQSEKEALNENKIVVEDSNFKIWTTVKIYATAFLFLVIIILLAFLLSSNKKQKMKEEIYSKVNNIMNGKTVVIDGKYFKTEGELKETGYGKKSTDKNDHPFPLAFPKWWEKDKLYAVYFARNGGFTIKELTRLNDDGFDIVTKFSGDMGYKMPISTYTPPEYWDDGAGAHIKTIDGYYSSNYQLSTDEYYLKAFDYFTKEDRESPGAYSPGKYVDITNLPDIRNEYYFMDNTVPKLFSSSGVQDSTWEIKSNVSNNKMILYIKTIGKHYEITENREAINNDLSKYLLIPIASFLLILLLILFSKPKYFRNLNLYGKLWRNTSHQEHFFIFEHSFLGKYKFSEIIDDNVSKGILKITDKGNILNLSYPNKDLFYKIEKVDSDNLTLISLKDENSISFIRNGANPTNERIQHDFIYAGFWKRFLASCIDFIIIFIISSIILGILEYCTSGELKHPPYSSYVFVHFIPSVVYVFLYAFMIVKNPLGLLFGWLYFALMESSAKQGTLGKLVLNIKVTDINGNKVSFGKATGRYFGKIISLLIIYIGYFMVAFTKQKQGLHDKIANCLVLRK